MKYALISGSLVLAALVAPSLQAAASTTSSARSSSAASRPESSAEASGSARVPSYGSDSSQRESSDAAARFKAAVWRDAEVRRIRSQLDSVGKSDALKANASRLAGLVSQLTARRREIARQEGVDMRDLVMAKPAGARMQPSGITSAVMKALSEAHYVADTPLTQIVELTEMPRHIASKSETPPLVATSSSTFPATGMVHTWVASEEPDGTMVTEARMGTLKLPGDPSKDGSAPLTVRVSVYFTRYDLIAIVGGGEDQEEFFKPDTYADLLIYTAASPGGTPQKCRVDGWPWLSDSLEHSGEAAIAECSVKAAPGSTIAAGVGLDSRSSVFDGEIAATFLTYEVSKITAQFVK